MEIQICLFEASYDPADKGGSSLGQLMVLDASMFLSLFDVDQCFKEGYLQIARWICVCFHGWYEKMWRSCRLKWLRPFLFSRLSHLGSGCMDCSYDLFGFRPWAMYSQINEMKLLSLKKKLKTKGKAKKKKKHILSFHWYWYSCVDHPYNCDYTTVALYPPTIKKKLLKI